MGAYDNMLEKILRKPTAKDIMPKELQSFLEHYGFVLKRVSGSHFIYECPSGTKHLTIPMHSPIKPAYIDQIRDVIDEGERG